MLPCYFDAKTLLGFARLFGMILALREVSIHFCRAFETTGGMRGRLLSLSSCLVFDAVLDPVPCGTTLEAQENLLDSVCGR